MLLKCLLYLMCAHVVQSSETFTSSFKVVSVDASSVSNATLASRNSSSLVHCAGLSNLDSCRAFMYDQYSACNMLNPFLLYKNGSASTIDVYLADVESPIIGNLIVVDGVITSNGQLTNDVEIINPISANSTCIKPPNYPLSLQAFSGGLVMGSFVACGGYNGADLSTCYMHDVTGNKWQLITQLPQKTRHAKSTVIGDLFLTTGGTAGSTILANSQAFSFGQGYVSCAAMPLTLCRHCMANINSTHILLVGGTGFYYTNPTVDIKNALILNVVTQQYILLSNIDQMRIDLFCGVIARSNGSTEVVIAGGSSDSGGSSVIISSRIYSFVTNSWRAGPNLPSAMSAGGSVQYGGNSFLIIHYSGIYKYDVANDAWITLPGKMKTPRRWFAFALVPPNYVQCS